MTLVWHKQSIPTAWMRAGGVLIPKEKNSSTINQFHHISLLNAEGNIFSFLAHRLAGCLEKNGYIHTTVQKAGESGFSGCLEHSPMIWNQIQAAKNDGRDLHVVLPVPLDLSHTSSSGPHSTTSVYQNPSLNSFIPIFKTYRSASQQRNTVWQPLEVGIMASCTISSLALSMEMEIIIRASRWVVEGQQTKHGLRLPPIRAHMDNLTILTTSKACTS